MPFCSNQRLLCILLVPALVLGLSGLSRSQEKQAAKTKYLFQYEEKKRVLLAKFPFFYEGHLDANGVFVPDPNARAIECKVSADERHEWIESLEKRKFPIHNLNRGGFMAQLVYQYLGGGLLMPGQIPGEDFVPLIDDKNTVQLIRFEDYLKTYDPNRHIRIYNLPGRIVAQEKIERQTK